MYVRTAGARDVPAVSILLRETWHDTYDAIYGPERVEEITNRWHSPAALERKLDQPHSEFLVADDGKTIAGTAFATAIESGRTVLLHQLYVRPGWQGRGIGGLLLDEIESAFHEAERVRVEVEERNIRAVAFYVGQGFAEVGRLEQGVGENAGEGPDLKALIFERPIMWADR